jgi:pimeloyl-ACP methyl ester carboxylesterase
MPFAQNQHLNLYYEIEGSGPPIVLAHGLTGSIDYWHSYGYVTALREQYTVILFDARGHGRSDKPHEPAAYDHQLMVSDILAVVDAVGIGRFHYWGYSMGGYIGYALAQQAPERLLTLISGGTDPYYQPDPDGDLGPLHAIFQRSAQEGSDYMVAEIRALFGAISPQYEARLRTLDPQAMAAYLAQARLRQGISEMVANMSLPVLLYSGEEDDCFQSNQIIAPHMANARFFSLPGLNHVSASAATAQIMPHVLSFLASYSG